MEYEDLMFIWDDEKNRRNLKKHGIDFETALFVFKDPNVVKIYDSSHSADEDRWNVIGIVEDVAVFVAETEITDTVIRIISARKANRKEREIYNNENGIS